MPFYQDLRAVFVAALVLFAAGCGARTDTSIPSATGFLQPAVTAGTQATRPLLRGATASGMLAASSCYPCATYHSGASYEYFFPIGFKHPRRVVSNGIAAPWVGLVFDTSGNLFVANCETCVTGQSGVNNVVGLKPKSATPFVTITNGITYPYDLAIDSAGTLYASNLGCYSPSCYGQVSEYPRGYSTGSPSATIQVRYPLGLALDSHKNLYVADCEVCWSGSTGSDQILVYAPGQTTPFRTISTGVNEPVALAIDSSNDLYVANCMNCGLGAAAYVSGTDTVTEYGYNGYPLKTITFGTARDVPFSLALDHAADLFVGNFALNTVTEYPPNATQPSRTISNGVSSPASLAATANEIYVSNAGANTVTGYSLANTRNRPNLTLSVPYPSSLAVSR